MKRFGSMVLALLMLCSAMAGCQNKSEDLGGNTPKSSGTDGTSVVGTDTNGDGEVHDYARITWLFNEGGNIVTPESYTVQKIKEDLNIDFVHIPLPAGMDYSERLSVLIAGGDTPDVIDSSTSLTASLLKEDVIIPIEDYLNEDYIPNVMRVSKDWEEVMQQQVWSDGHTYAITSVKSNPLEDHPWIRQDWLDKLNLKVPTTLEELAVVLEAFSKGDPNGDGLPVYGTMANEFYGFNPFMDAMAAGSYWYKGADGLPEIGYLSPRVVEALEYCKGLVDSGAINSDFITLTADQVNEKLKAGSVGYMYSWNGTAQEKDMQQLYPDAKWVPMTPVKGVYDKGYINILEKSQVRNWYVVSKSCKDVDAVFRLMDYMCVDTSDETHMTFEGSYWNMLGVPGVNYEIVDAAKGIIETGDGASGDEALAKKYRDQNAIDKWVGSPSRRFVNQFDTRWKGIDPENKANLDFLLSLPRGVDIPKDDPLRPYPETVVEDSVISAFTDDYGSYKYPEQLIYNALLGKGGGDIQYLYDTFLENANKAGYQDVRQRMAKILEENGY